MLRNGLLRYILYTCPKSIVMNLTTCTHGAHKIHSCKNKGVHTAKPFRVYRRGSWPRIQMRPLTACTDEAVTLATLARTIRVYLRPWPRTIRVYLRPQKARAQPNPWPQNDVRICCLRKLEEVLSCTTFWCHHLQSTKIWLKKYISTQNG